MSNARSPRGVCSTTIGTNAIERLLAMLESAAGRSLLDPVASARRQLDLRVLDEERGSCLAEREPEPSRSPLARAGAGRRAPAAGWPGPSRSTSASTSASLADGPPSRAMASSRSARRTACSASGRRSASELLVVPAAPRPGRRPAGACCSRACSIRCADLAERPGDSGTTKSWRASAASTHRLLERAPVLALPIAPRGGCAPRRGARRASRGSAHGLGEVVVERRQHPSPSPRRPAAWLARLAAQRLARCSSGKRTRLGAPPAASRPITASSISGSTRPPPTSKA